MRRPANEAGASRDTDAAGSAVVRRGSSESDTRTSVEVCASLDVDDPVSIDACCSGLRRTDTTSRCRRNEACVRRRPTERSGLPCPTPLRTCGDSSAIRLSSQLPITRSSVAAPTISRRHRAVSGPYSGRSPKMKSASTDAPFGNCSTPTDERVCTPSSPSTAYSTSDAPSATSLCIVKSGALRT